MARRSEDFSTERAAYEAHIASLTDQITWLRATVESLTGLGPRVATQGPPAPLMESKLWESEEESDIREMLEAGLIDAADATAALEAAGALSTDIDFP